MAFGKVLGNTFLFFCFHGMWKGRDKESVKLESECQQHANMQNGKNGNVIEKCDNYEIRRK